MLPNPFAEEAARAVDAVPPAARPDQRAPVRHSAPELRAPVIEYNEHPGRPRSTWPSLLVIVVLLALVGTAYVMLHDRNSAGPQLASVPGVIGLSETEAMANIKAAGFRYMRQGVQPSAHLAQDVVLQQDPQKGWIEVPNVVGMSEEKAGAELRAAGLDVVTNTEATDAQPVGTVLRQRPDATTQVDAGSTVTITVSTAARVIAIPLLSGMSQDSALAALSSMRLSATARAVPSQLPAGTVVGQDPAVGTEVQPGSSVVIDVSNAPAATTVRVPAVAALGLTQAQAKAALAQYGLKARVITQETRNSRPGLCIYQEPAAGVEVKIGGTVRIIIARVPTLTTTASPPPTTASPPPT